MSLNGNSPGGCLAGLHPLRLDHWGRTRCDQELDQSLSRCLILSIGADARRQHNIRLNLFRKRADDPNSSYSHQLRNQLYRHVGLTFDDKLSSAAAWNCLALGLYLICDAEIFNHFGELKPTLAGSRIGDGFCVQQRALECIDRADVGSRRTFLHRNTDAGARDINSRAVCDLTLLDEFVN